MKNTKTIILVVLLLIVIATGAVFFAGTQMGIHQFVGSNPDTARLIGNSIIDYEIPNGYQEQGGRDIGPIQMVLIAASYPGAEFLSESTILVTTFPSGLGLSEGQFQQELRLASLRSSGEVSTMAYVGEGTGIVQGQKVVLKIYESFGEYDPPTRIVISSAFPGKSESIILMFAGPISKWDQLVIDDFMTSIK
jgi:hypothetical protein